MNRKNLVQELIEMVLENEIDIIMTVEAENLDIQHLLSKLKKEGKKFQKKEVLPQKRGIIFLSDVNIAVSVYKEEKYFAAYKIHEDGQNRLMIVTHFVSAMYKSETARNQRANDLAKEIEKLEEACNKEADRRGEPRYHTILVGDFNLHPFSAGIIGAHGFNAVMDQNRALQQGKTKFYYNPMWNLMGKRESALGTYYYESDQDDNSFYWYTFDQVLLRPELIHDFVWDEFKIIDHIGNDSLIRNHKIYKAKYSDHLPIKFAITRRDGYSSY